MIKIDITTAPQPLNLTHEAHLSWTKACADQILSQACSLDQICTFESENLQQKETVPLAVHLATKMAKSKWLVRAWEEPFFVSVVFAAYNEHQRILTSQEHPHGENFLLRKIDQLSWLFDGNDHQWELLMVAHRVVVTWRFPSWTRKTSSRTFEFCLLMTQSKANSRWLHL